MVAQWWPDGLAVEGLDVERGVEPGLDVLGRVVKLAAA